MEETATQSKARKTRRSVVGIVTSANKTPKTLRVEVQYRVRHWHYGKYLQRRTVLHAHDEKSEARKGDKVQLMECRPISRTKTWRLVKILEAAPRE